MLSLLSTATHLATLLTLVQDYKRDWVLRWLRQFFMFVNLLLNVLYGIFVLETKLRNLAPTLPIACVWAEHADNAMGNSNKVLSVVGTIAVIAVTVILFILSTWYLHMRRQVWGKVVRSVGLLVLVALAIGAAARVIIASSAFGGTAAVKLTGPSEGAWSFGQLLGVLMLILPFISALEILRGMSDRTLPEDQCLHIRCCRRNWSFCTDVSRRSTTTERKRVEASLGQSLRLSAKSALGRENIQEIAGRTLRLLIDIALESTTTIEKKSSRSQGLMSTFVGRVCLARSR